VSTLPRKNATSEINLTKDFVAREEAKRSAYAKRIFRKNYLDRGLAPPAQCAKPSKKGRLSAVKASTSSSASSGAPHLDSAKNFDKDHPVMDRLGWPLERFSFDNSVARYEPSHPTPSPN
jgi:hypothetical protein